MTEAIHARTATTATSATATSATLHTTARTSTQTHLRRRSTASSIPILVRVGPASNSALASTQASTSSTLSSLSSPSVPVSVSEAESTEALAPKHHREQPERSEQSEQSGEPEQSEQSGTTLQVQRLAEQNQPEQSSRQRTWLPQPARQQGRSKSTGELDSLPNPLLYLAASHCHKPQQPSIRSSVDLLQEAVDILRKDLPQGMASLHSTATSSRNGGSTMPSLSKYLETDQKTTRTEPMSPETKSSTSIINKRQSVSSSQKPADVTQQQLPNQLPNQLPMTDAEPTPNQNSNHSLRRSRHHDRKASQHATRQSTTSETSEPSFALSSQHNVNKQLLASDHTSTKSKPMPAWKLRELQKRRWNAPSATVRSPMVPKRNDSCYDTSSTEQIIDLNDTPHDLKPPKLHRVTTLRSICSMETTRSQHSAIHTSSIDSSSGKRPARLRGKKPSMQERLQATRASSPKKKSVLAPHERTGVVLHHTPRLRHRDEPIVDHIPHRVKFAADHDIVKDDSQCSTITVSVTDFMPRSSKYHSPQQRQRKAVIVQEIMNDGEHVVFDDLEYDDDDDLDDDELPTLPPLQDAGWQLRERSKYVDARPHLPSRHSSVDDETLTQDDLVNFNNGRSDADTEESMANDYAAVVLPAAARTRGISISNGTDHTPSTGAAPPPPPPYLDNSPAKPKRRSSMEEKLDGGIQPSGNRNLPPRPKGAPIYSTTTAIPSMFDCFPSLPVRRSSRHTQQSGSTNTTQSQKRAFPRFSTMLSKTGPVIPPLPDGLAIATRHSTKSRAETVSNIDPDDDAAPLCPKRRSSAEDGSAARYEKNQAALTNKSQSTLPPFFAIVEEEIKRLSSLTFGSDNAARCTSSAPSSPKAAQEDASFPNESAHTTKSVLGNSLTAALEAWGKLDEIRSSFSDKPQKQQAEEEEEHPVLAANTRWAKLRGAQKWITGAKQKTEQSFIQRRFGKKPAWKLREEAKAAIHPSIIKKVPEEDQEYELADLVAPEPVGNNDPFTYQTAFLSTSSLDISLSTDAC